MAGVRHITSTITEGSSVTTVEFRLETDTDRAVNDVRNAITQIRGNLPQNIDNPVVERMDTEGGALGYYAVQSPNMNQTELSWFIDDAVSRELLAVNGVQQVKRLGGEKREVRVSRYIDMLNQDVAKVREEKGKKPLKASEKAAELKDTKVSHTDH